MKKLPRIITKQEYEKLLAVAIKLRNKSKGKRKKIINQYIIAMILGFEAGMRISEILGLKRKFPPKGRSYALHPNWKIKPLEKSQIEVSSIRILGAKGGKDRIVPRPKKLNDKAVNQFPLKIKRRALQDFVTKLGKQVLDKEISFHTFRHGFATHYYNQTKDIRGLQQVLGHSRIDTTSIYAHTNPEETIKKIQEVF